MLTSEVVDATLVVMMFALEEASPLLVMSFTLEGSGLRFLLLLLAVVVSAVLLLKSP